MNQSTERGVREATEWVDKEIARARLVSRDEFLDDRFIPAPILRTIRTALEEYGKPKTVSREWVEKLMSDIFYAYEYLKTTKDGIIEYVISEMKIEGIEVEGETPDDKS